MNVDRLVLAIAGTLVLASVVLATLVSAWWLLLAGFVGANLLQASITGFCPAAVLLRRLGELENETAGPEGPAVLNLPSIPRVRSLNKQPLVEHRMPGFMTWVTHDG